MITNTEAIIIHTILLITFIIILEFRRKAFLDEVWRIRIDGTEQAYGIKEEGGKDVKFKKTKIG